MATKRYDLAINLGEYTNAQGETKNRYHNIGVIMEGDKGPYLLLNALYVSSQLNGLVNKERRESLIVSMFEPKGEGEQRRAPQKTAPAATAAAAPFDDDDIPF